MRTPSRPPMFREVGVGKRDILLPTVHEVGCIAHHASGVTGQLVRHLEFDTHSRPEAFGAIL